MTGTQLVDTLPIGAAFVLFAVIMLAAYEAGFRVGRWWQIREPGEQEGPTSMLVGSILALLAFLLAVTMGMASDRFDARRALVGAEADAIQTTYLRAGYLPEPASTRSRDLLREYVPLRLVVTAASDATSVIRQSREIQRQLWTLAEETARTTTQGDLVGLYIESLNEVINTHEERVTARIARVPETVVLLLLAGSALSLAMVGFNSGLSQRRSMLSAAVLIVALSAVLTIVVDLDRPREGFIQVSQQPLIDLQEQIGSPPP
jgi:hypothetical protein